MSATAGNTDSNLSGKPNDDIDKQKGPATGSNVESPGGTLGTGSAAAQGSSGGNDAGNAQQQQQKQS